jgi:hypothetical protein
VLLLLKLIAPADIVILYTGAFGVSNLAISTVFSAIGRKQGLDVLSRKSTKIGKEYMEYHYVVAWSEEKGWYLDWASTLARINNGRNVYVPNLDEWTIPVHDSETGEKEEELTLMLEEVLEQLNK